MATAAVTPNAYWLKLEILIGNCSLSFTNMPICGSRRVVQRLVSTSCPLPCRSEFSARFKVTKYNSRGTKPVYGDPSGLVATP